MVLLALAPVASLEDVTINALKHDLVSCTHRPRIIGRAIFQYRLGTVAH